MSEDKRVIQSYVRDKWFVSTIYRESSVAMIPAPWFYETLVWEWNPETKERGNIVHQAEGINSHCEICANLIRGLPPEGEQGDD